jgi:hypothetical protein
MLNICKQQLIFNLSLHRSIRDHIINNARFSDTAGIINDYHDQHLH